MVRTFGASDPSRRVPTPREIWVTPQGSCIIFFIFLRSPSRTRESFVFDAREP